MFVASEFTPTMWPVWYKLKPKKFPKTNPQWKDKSFHLRKPIVELQKRAGLCGSLFLSGLGLFSHPKNPDPETMETPDPPNDTPGASKQVATWHPMTSQGFLGQEKCGCFAVRILLIRRRDGRRTLTIWPRKANNIMVLAQVGRVFGRVRSEKLRYKGENYMPVDSKWPFYPQTLEVTNNLLKGSLNYPKKVTSRIARWVLVSKRIYIRLNKSDHFSAKKTVGFLGGGFNSFHGNVRGPPQALLRETNG